MLNNITNKTTTVLQRAFTTDLTSCGVCFSKAQQNHVGTVPAVQLCKPVWEKQQ
jgi:hypothetical protein